MESARPTVSQTQNRNLVTELLSSHLFHCPPTICLWGNFLVIPYSFQVNGSPFSHFQHLFFYCHVFYLHVRINDSTRWQGDQSHFQFLVFLKPSVWVSCRVGTTWSHFIYFNHCQTQFSHDLGLRSCTVGVILSWISSESMCISECFSFTIQNIYNLDQASCLAWLPK